MSDIISTKPMEDSTASFTVKQKNTDTDTSDHTPSKKLRLDIPESTYSQDQASIQASSSAASDTAMPPSPQSLQTASTSSSSSSYNSEWTSLFKDQRIPVPYNDFQNPRQLLSHLIPSIDVHKLPSNLGDFDVCRLIYQLMSDSGNSSVPNRGIPMLSDMFMIQREKLKEFNTMDQCVELIANSKNVIVLTGAGCSVSCGIPDFRSRDGVYARLRVDFPDLPDPQAMFDIFYFDHDPRPFFKFAKEIYPGQFQPSLSHLFIRKLEENKKLLRNYTQNIDTLEMTAGIKNVIQCHGSFATATCTTCKLQVDADHIREKILNQEIPYCEVCKINETPSSAEAPETPDSELKPVLSTTEATTALDTHSTATEEEEKTDQDYDPLNDTFVYKKNNSAGILKPDIVFFGEGLPELYHKSIGEDKTKCDLLIVIGSSLKVKPVANIPHLLPQKVPQILINRESLKHLNFDIELLGDCDVIVNELLLRLEQRQSSENSEKIWSNICTNTQLLTEICDEEAENLLFANRDQLDSSSNSPDTSTVIIDNKSKPSEVSGIETDQAEGEKSAEKIKSDDQLSVGAGGKKYTTDYLREGSFLYLKPNMHVFHGAEIQLKHARRKLRRLNKLMTETEEDSEKSNAMSDDDSDDDSDEDDSDMTSDDEEEEEDNEEAESNEEESQDCENKPDPEAAAPSQEAVTTKEYTESKQISAEDLNESDSESDDDDFDPAQDSFDKKNLIEFLNEENEFDEDDDDEEDDDFTPETTNVKSKKHLVEFISDTFSCPLLDSKKSDA